MFFLYIFPCEAIKNLSTKQDDRGTGYTFPAAIYLPKVNNRNTRTRCEICSKSTLTYFKPCSTVSIVNFEHVIAGWVVYLDLFCDIPDIPRYT